MRERNKKYSNNIGDLIEEINNQDLEAVNGGQDMTKYSILDYMSCNCPPELSSEAICGEFTSDVVMPVVTKLFNCK